MNLFYLAEYSDIYVNQINKDELLKSIEINSFFIILSKLGYYKKIENKERFDSLLKLLPQNEFLKNIEDYISSHELITRQGVLGIWKAILTQSQTSFNTKPLIPKKTFNNALKLILDFQENLEKELSVDEIDTNNYLSSNAFFNYYDDLYHVISRAYYIFVKNKYINANADVYGINCEFTDKYGLSIDDYICATYAICCTFDNMHSEIVNNSDYLRAEWAINSLKILSESKIGHVAWNKLLSLISFDYAEGNKWAFENIEKPTDYTLFRYKPLYKINDYLYIPIERRLLNDLLFHNLIYKINNCQKGNNFYIKLGHMFQYYLEHIVEQFIKTTNDEYNFIHEFAYFTENKQTNKKTPDKRSPDIIIVHKNTVLVVEVKSARIPYQVNDYVESTFDLNLIADKFIFSPLMQAITATHSIVFDDIVVKGSGTENQIDTTNRVKDELTNDKLYYFLTVNMSNLPYQNFEAKDFIENVKNLNENNKMKYGGFYSINIEEFELLIKLLCQKNAKPMSYYLEHYRKVQQNETLSFKSFLVRIKKKDFKCYDNENNPITQLGIEAVNWIKNRM